MKISRLKFWIGTLALLLSLSPLQRNARADRPLTLVSLDSTYLEDARHRLSAKDSSLQPALKKLLSAADKALEAKPESVMDKKRVPPSGDKHDYLSLAPYFWPDPAKPNGLPYIRRDGEVNKEIRNSNDNVPLDRLCNNVETLALAYYFTNDARYATKAVGLLNTWFLAPDTHMNPNLKYGQGIPGITEGRGTGIIDTHGLIRITNALGILEGSAPYTPQVRDGLKNWFRQFADWLTTSKIGKDEAKSGNNHETWYDAQVAAYRMVAGDREGAIEAVKKGTQLIARQIEADGKMPKELARTKSYSYSIFNLQAHFTLAAIAHNLNTDLYKYQTPDGRGIRTALDYVAPYIDGKKRWPGQQIAEVKQPDAALAQLLRQAALVYNEPRYETLIQSNEPEKLADNKMNLLWPAKKEPNRGNTTGSQINKRGGNPSGAETVALVVPGGEGVMRGYTIPVRDLATAKDHQFLVDREEGQYLGHVTTHLLDDGKTILAVYPKGHGRGAICYKRSTDGGKTWSDRLPTPASWATSLEVPTIFRAIDKRGKKRLLLFSGLHPIRLSVSEDEGATWSELKPIGNFGGIVAMGCMERLKNGDYVAMFHDDGRYFAPPGLDGTKPKATGEFTLYQTISKDGGLTWGTPQAIYRSREIHLCEPGIIRSPDGKQLAVLLRENRRVKNSHVIFSNDEAKHWTAPRELPGALTGDRHTAKYLPDGRLFISFRDTTLESATKGDWVAWVGRYSDIVDGKEGEYRIRLMKNYHAWDCAYPGVEVLPDGTVVTTTYGHWEESKQPYIVAVRLLPSDLSVP